MGYEEYRNKAQKQLASDESDAEKRFNEHESQDPFPEITPALLNSADIFKYVCKTGMIYPFDMKDLEGASYEVRIKGKVVLWNEEDEKKQEIILDNDLEVFELRPNSIAFLTLEPTFRIPDYLALRFNLTINHVYKGLLLGTGPLVDPGFVGKLSIPLHNLTANSQFFKMRDSLIKIDFTKLSFYKNCNSFNNKDDDFETTYIKTDIQPNRDIDFYIGRAAEHGSMARSSIPIEIKKNRKATEEAKKEAEKAREQAEKAREQAEKVRESAQEQIEKIQEKVTATTTKFTFAGAISGALVIITLLGVFATLFIHFNTRYDGLTSDYIILYQELHEENIKNIEILEDKIDELENQINQNQDGNEMESIEITENENKVESIEITEKK